MSNEDKDENVEVEVGQVWKHERTGRRYEILGVGLKVKAPSDATWHDGVEYTLDAFNSAEPADGQVYVRTSDDFKQKFSFDA